jgi:hypothetical protein
VGNAKHAKSAKNAKNAKMALSMAGEAEIS